jgi:hypothetical protein
MAQVVTTQVACYMTLPAEAFAGAAPKAFTSNISTHLADMRLIPLDH